MNIRLPSLLSRFSVGLFLFASAISSQAAALSMEVVPSQRIIHAGDTQRLFVKIGLTGGGFADHHRPPANIAIVLDKSGSMSGLKMMRAKEAAIMAINRLGPRDTVSVIAYSGRVEIIQPSTRATDKELVTESIRRIYASGSTALFAGVTRGAAELRKYLSRNHINRVILLSDGQANVGPKSPSELGQLGEELSEEGISVTTIGLGLGYNEDLMTRLAQYSGGNHAFVESANDLARIFNREFNDVLSVVANDATINIRLRPGIKPIRVFGHKATIKGRSITVKINQIYAKQQKYVIVELEVPASQKASHVTLADIKTSYLDLGNKKRRSSNSQLKVATSESRQRATNSIDKKVMSAAVEYIAINKSKRAVRLRDAGQYQAAATEFKKNAAWLRKNARKYKSKKLEGYAKEQLNASGTVASPAWNKTRKMIRKGDYSRSVQQSF